MTTQCPKCKKARLIELQGRNPKIQSWVCPVCAYYDSNSEAFTLYPYLFQDLGRTILLDIKNKLEYYGLDETEAEVWLHEEPAFESAVTRRIVTPFDNRRRGNRTKPATSSRPFAIEIQSKTVIL